MPDILDAARGKPTCLSVVLCNEIIEDKRTNNKTLVSLFNLIAAPELPATHPRFCIMASLHEGIGKWQVEIRIVSPSGAQLFTLPFEYEFKEPLQVEDIVIEIQGLILPQPGVYSVDVLVGGSQISNRRFTVSKLEARGHE